jgi:hypothetical protein
MATTEAPQAARGMSGYSSRSPSYAIHSLQLKLHVIFFLPCGIFQKVNSANNDWGS